MRKMNLHREKGFVIVLAMIALMATTFFVMTGVMTTTSTLKVAGNYTRTVGSFNLAETGLAKARPIVETTDYDDLVSCGGKCEIIGRTSFNDGTYEVKAFDNDDGDGNTANDSDNIIVIESIGRNAAGGAVTIEAHIQKNVVSAPEPFPAQPGGGGGAAMLCGEESEISAGGASSIDGYDHGVPTLPCPVSGCPVGPVVNPGGYAVVGEGDITATGNLVSTNSPAFVDNVSDTQCDEWRLLRDELAALDESSPDVIVLGDAHYQTPINDCTDPKVFILNRDGNIKFSANAEACGIFVVAADVVIDVQGNAVLVGVMLVMGDEANLSFVEGHGNPEFYGQVIVESTEADRTKEVSLTGTADLFFSTEAMGYANQAMNDALSGGGGGGGGGLITMAWKETY